MRTPLLLIAALLLGGCKVYKNTDIPIDDPDQYPEETGFERYTLRICEELVANLEGTLPEIIPYPSYVPCGDVDKLSLEDRKAKIKDETYIFINPITDIFIYASTKNVIDASTNKINLNNLDQFYIGRRRGTSVYFKHIKTYIQQSRGKKPKYRAGKLFKWEIKVDTSDQSIGIEKLPFLEGGNQSITMVAIDSVFNTPLQFLLKDTDANREENAENYVFFDFPKEIDRRQLELSFYAKSDPEQPDVFIKKQIHESYIKYVPPTEEEIAWIEENTVD